MRKCARDSGYERSVFLMRLKERCSRCFMVSLMAEGHWSRVVAIFTQLSAEDVAFEVQKPVLEKWGFEGNEHGVREMTAAIRAHADKEHAFISQCRRSLRCIRRCRLG